MPKSALLPCPADRRETLEAIALILRGGALSDPSEDLAAWVAGVEVVEGLQRAGFTVVRTTPPVVSDALARLESMAAAGCPPDEVAHEAEAIATGWWWNVQGDLTPDRLVVLVQQLQHWCIAASGYHALRWDHLNRAGRPQEAEDAARWAQALDQAQRVLRVYA